MAKKPPPKCDICETSPAYHHDIYVDGLGDFAPAAHGVSVYLCDLCFGLACQMVGSTASLKKTLKSMKLDFKIGEIVVLVTGGPQMEVIGINSSDATGPVHIWCKWYEEEKFCTHSFFAEKLCRIAAKE